MYERVRREAAPLVQRAVDALLLPPGSTKLHASGSDAATGTLAQIRLCSGPQFKRSSFNCLTMCDALALSVGVLCLNVEHKSGSDDAPCVVPTALNTLSWARREVVHTQGRPAGEKLLISRQGAFVRSIALHHGSASLRM